MTLFNAALVVAYWERLFVLVEHDEVVEQPHRRAQRRKSDLFMQRQAGRTVEMIHLQNAALCLRECGGAARDQAQ